MTKKILAAAFALVGLFPLAANAALSDVCPTVKALSRPVLWKAKASGHIQGDARGKSSSLIYGLGARSIPAYTCIMGYNSQGEVIHKLGAYARNGRVYKARYYGGWGCGDKKTPAAVKRQAGRSDLYLRVSPGVCLKVPNSGILGRIGSVR